MINTQNTINGNFQKLCTVVTINKFTYRVTCKQEHPGKSSAVVIDI